MSKAERRLRRRIARAEAGLLSAQQPPLDVKLRRLVRALLKKK